MGKKDYDELSEGPKVRAGHPCLYLLFATFNSILMVSSLGIGACDVYMFILCKGANFINIFFAILAVCLLLLTTCACYLRRSVTLLAFYLLINLVLFIAMFILCAVLMLNKDMV